MPELWPNFLVSSCICVASSRVGAITSVVGPARGSGRSFMIRMNAGTMKASVLPEPVLATPTTSCPRIARPHEAAWMGVGVGKPARLMSVMIDCGRLADSKVMKGSGAPRGRCTSCLAHHACTSADICERSLALKTSLAPYDCCGPPGGGGGGPGGPEATGRSQRVSLVSVFQ